MVYKTYRKNRISKKVWLIKLHTVLFFLINLLYLHSTILDAHVA